MSARDSKISRGLTAAQLLDSAEFKNAFTSVRDAVISEIEKLALDGTNDATAVSLVRDLQAARNFKKYFVSLVRSADSQSKRQDLKDEPIPFDPTAR